MGEAHTDSHLIYELFPNNSKCFTIHISYYLFSFSHLVAMHQLYTGTEYEATSNARSTYIKMGTAGICRLDAVQPKYTCAKQILYSIQLLSVLQTDCVVGGASVVNHRKSDQFVEPTVVAYNDNIGKLIGQTK